MFPTLCGIVINFVKVIIHAFHFRFRQIYAIVNTIRQFSANSASFTNKMLDGSPAKKDRLPKLAFSDLTPAVAQFPPSRLENKARELGSTNRTAI
jgi:hypothetical protein